MYQFDEKRLAKLELLRAEGIEPYPHGFSVRHTVAEVQTLIGDREAADLTEDETVVCLAGRLMFKNEMGKAGFGRIQDRSGRIQIYLKKNVIGEDAFAVWKRMDLGDHVHVVGRLMRTRTGEATVSAQEFQLAGKCIASMPDKHKGISDPEFRNRNRHVDLFMDMDSAATFRARSEIVRHIRNFFDDRGFLEVETPMMHPIPGGANARPFITHHNALNLDMYLRVAPELYLKRLVVGGFERVYEINRNFRNEGVDTTHNPEFTMLEFYQAYATWEDLMALTEELVSGVAAAVTGGTTVTYGEHELDLSAPWRRLRMSDAIAEATGLSNDAVHDPDALRQRWLRDHPDAEDMPSTVGKWFEWFFDAYVEDGLIQPTFITHYPIEISPLSRRSAAEPEVAERFELFVVGTEIANGFNELSDPVDQAARFAAQAQARDAGDGEAMYFDAEFINALTYGLPPTAGEGLGIDRLVMLLTNRQSIRDVVLFPALRPRSTEGSSGDPSGDTEG